MIDFKYLGRIAAIALICASGTAWAQEVVGTAVVEGEKVTLFADGTWEYATPTVGDCKVVARNLSFCGSPREWQRVSNAPAPLAAQYKRRGFEYGQMLVEDIGLDQGMNLKLMRDAALQNAGQASGQAPEDVLVLADDPITVDDIDGITLAYAVEFRGSDVVFANTLLLTQDQAMQLQTFVGGTDDFSDKHRTLHAEFLDQIEVGP